MIITHGSEEWHALIILSEHGTISATCRPMAATLRKLSDLGLAAMTKARSRQWFTISVKGIAALRNAG